MKRILTFLLLVLLFSSGVANAYEKETHVFLTNETIDFYNKNFPDKKIAENLRNFLLEGAFREDDFPRYLNHFYDPILDRGLTYDPRIERNIIKDNFWRIVGSWTKSKDWAVNELAQNQAIFQTSAIVASILTAVQQKNVESLSAQTDFTWQKALDFYAKGETEKAFFTLGHILHLIEDLSVPEHTRNDHHPGDSPYENYTGRFNLNNPDESLTKRLDREKPVIFRDLKNYFNELATYTNKNFFSKDTIQIVYEYPKLDIENLEIINGFYYIKNKDQHNNEYFLATKRSLKNSVITNSNDINIDNDLTIESYWRILSTKAVQYSAGVINLFFEQAEKAKQEYEKNKKQEIESQKANILELIRNRAFDIVHEWNQAARVAASEALPIMYDLPSQEIPTEIAITEEPTETEETATELPIGEISELSAEESADLENQINVAISQISAIRGTISLLSEVRQENVRTEETAENSGDSLDSAAANQTSSNRSSGSFSGGSSSNNPTAVVEEDAPPAEEPAENEEGSEAEEEAEPAPAAPNQSPIATFSYSPSNPALGDTVQFDAASSTDTDGEIISYNWDFGDGQATSAASTAISHSYAATGTFAVVLTTTDDESATDSATAAITIIDPPVIIADHIVISEVIFDAEGNDNKKEFTELYNPTDQDIDLENWELRYERENGNTARLAFFNKNADQTIIPAKGFLLIGLNNYDEDNFNGRLADIKRNNDMLNGRRNGEPETIRVYLLDTEENEVDDMSYDENSIEEEGQSLERLAWQSGYCVSGQGDGEYLGQACDRDSNEEDWQVRTTPNPQNSGNLPEPRTAPTMPTDFTVAFQAVPRPELVFGWNWSTAYNNSTSGLTYQIREYDYASSTAINLDSTASGTSQYVQEIGRDYRFTIRAVDVEGFGSATSTAQTTAPSFATAINFFRNPSATSSAYVELYYESYPFIPQSHLFEGRPWSVTAFYLNQEAPGGDLGNNNWTNAGANALAFDYEACGVNFSGPVIIWPENSDKCSYEWGVPRRYAMNWDSYLNEDNHLLIGTNANNPAFQTGNYLTVAYYSYAGDNNQALIAIDKTHYVFQEEVPEHQAPIFGGGEFSLNFNGTVSRLTVSAPTAADSDTLDGNIVYELRIATSSEALASTTPINGGNGYSLYAAAGYNYFFNLRARDNFSNYAAGEFSGQWSYPISETVLYQGQSGDWSNSWGAVPNNCNYGNDGCYDSRSVQSLLFATDTIFQIANVMIQHSSGDDTAVLTMDLYADSGNNPDFTTTLASTTVSNFNSSSPAEISFIFSNPITLTADQRYWLGLRVSEYGGDGNSRFHFNNFVNALTTDSESIPNGNAGYRSAGSAAGSHQADRDWFLKLFR